MKNDGMGKKVSTTGAVFGFHTWKVNVRRRKDNFIAYLLILVLVISSILFIDLLIHILDIKHCVLRTVLCMGIVAK